ncbi:MAG TPA: phosphotransferase [Polyangia bacterium]|nr:phosphotransferase [Polyangia bacterium]
MELQAHLVQARVLPHYLGLDGAQIAPLGRGLVNQTYLISRGGVHFVLQRLNPVFSAAVNDNIDAVTRRLADLGMATPRLVPTRDGSLSVDLGVQAGLWRLLTYVEGVSFDAVASLGQARAAGCLVARFHRALDGLDHEFAGLRTGVHDTAQHLARLREALEVHADHRLHREVSVLAADLLAAVSDLPPLPNLPRCVCHGDPKLNNILFAGFEPPAAEQAVCLIDLDTVGPMALAHELGDAWRSWCNRSPEDASKARFDVEIFRASFEGFRDSLGRPLGADERRACLHGVEWISLELSARFAADALLESYFGWASERYPGRGEHNLARARGQWALHRAVCATQRERARILEIET